MPNLEDLLYFLILLWLDRKILNNVYCQMDS